ncbi:type I polyketide synthase, partial [Actinoplanes subglobosus]
MAEPEIFVPDAEPGPKEVPGAAPDLIRRLSSVPVPEQTRILLDVVRAQAADVLRRIRPGEPPLVDVARPFKEMGFDSIAAVELHARLQAATGVELPVTIVFDCPTPATMARYLRAELLGLPEEAAATARASAVDDEPIAIVGIGCRYPGGVASAEDLWRLVDEGREVLGSFPTDRGWAVDSMFDSDPDTPGKSYVDVGGFLGDATLFDAEFFGISPREALAMDPQQRLMLETAWEALERTGIDPSSLRGSSTGVFIGAEVHEYGVRVHEAPEGLDGYLMTGNAPSVASGRVAYVLGLEGPAITVDTACSGSIVSLHLAVQALRRGECTLALAGGVTVMGSPGMFTAFSRQRGLAADGRCKAFAAAADGTGFSEGIGLLVVERLSDARRNGHTVLALVRGSAVNQDGASNGLTAPSGTAQRRLIEQALASAALTAAQVDAVDAHGTGTRLGDPIEAHALIAAYGQNRPADRPLWLGSVKSNLGHTQAAGGVASVIKMVMAMRAGVLPRTLHVDAPTPHVNWSSGNVRLLTEPVDWPAAGEPRRAGISAFGISGTNAHVIIEEPPADDTAGPAAQPRDGEPVPVVVSASDEAALRSQAGRLLALLDAEPGTGLADLGSSLATTRAALGRRAAVVAGDLPALREPLLALAAGEDHPRLLRGAARAGGTAFLFTGQGSQRLGMGRELFRAYPVFAEALEEAIGHLDLQLDRSLWDVLFAAEGSPEAGLLHQTVYSQSALFAVETALYRLVESFGLRPDFLAGHSIGELTAAHVAGVLSLQDAATLVAARGRLMQALPSGGAMIAVQATEDEVLPLLAGHEDSAGIAAVNGPQAVVISGELATVERIAEELAGRGRKTRRLTVSHGFHSPLMEPMLAGFREIAAILDYSAPLVPVVSTVTGRIATTEELCSPDYWVRHVRQAVRFADGVRTLLDSGVTTFVEIGPDAVLSAMGGQTAGDEDDVTFVPVLRRDRDEQQEVLTALATAHVRGVPVDWHAYWAGSGARRVALPTYAFQRRRFWLSAAPADGNATGLGQIDAGHPMLQAVVGVAGTDGAVLTGRISVKTHPWLADHLITGVALLPGTALVELALHAADQVGCDRLDELTLQTPVLLPDQGGLAVQVVVGAAGDDGRRTVEIWSHPDGDATDAWTKHAEGLLARATAQPTGWRPESWPPAGAQPVDITGLYDDLAGQGYDYGPAFHGLRAVWRLGADAYAEVALPPELAPAASAYGLHPALLDAVLHATEFAGQAGEGTRLPFAWTGVTLASAGAAALRVRITATGTDAVALDLADTTGAPVGGIESFVLRTIDTARLRTTGTTPLYRLGWRPRPVVSPEPGSWTVVAGLDELTTVPDVVAVEVAPAGGDVPAAVADAAGTTLALIQRWLADDRFAASRLVLVTRSGVAAADGDPIDLRVAPVWGLVRAAQNEHPGRFTVVDVDGDDMLPAITVTEPEAAVRGGEVLVPRLEPAPGDGDGGFGTGTVLVTGGTGGLGATVARHLVEAHGVTDLVLVSRHGTDAPGAADLSALAARVRVLACDVTDRAAVERLIGEIGPELSAVVHAAGVIDDGLIASL